LIAVVYHADATFCFGGAAGDVYERLFKRFREMCNKHEIPVVHLSTEGHPGWGDENHRYGNLDPKNVVLNREECFTKFLECAPDDVYWFTEPDYVIKQMWPALDGDCAMLYRPDDGVPMTPSWRMATPKALPFFVKLRDTLRELKPHPGVGFDWHGDSWAFTNVWKEMGSPKGRANYLGLDIEFRAYKDYVKFDNVYGMNYAAHRKFALL